MYTSCGWFFHDLAGIETIQILRYAARALDLMADLGEAPPTDAFLDILDQAESNEPREGAGRQVWARHVVPARVGPERVVAHLALLELLEGAPPGPVVGGYEVTVEQHNYEERGVAALCAGRARLVHRRTRRTQEFVFAALHLGALDVVGACRLSGDPHDDANLVDALMVRWRAGDRLTAVLRGIVQDFGPGEFGLSAALPGAEGRILERTARSLTDRFTAEFDRLLADNRRSLAALAEADYPLPTELRTPIELALSRRLLGDLVALSTSDDRLALQSAAQTTAEAVEAGVSLARAEVASAATEALRAVASRAVASGDDDEIEAALRLVRLLPRGRDRRADRRRPGGALRRPAGRRRRAARRARTRARPGRRRPRRAAPDGSASGSAALRPSLAAPRRWRFPRCLRSMRRCSGSPVGVSACVHCAAGVRSALARGASLGAR